MFSGGNSVVMELINLKVFVSRIQVLVYSLIHSTVHVHNPPHNVINQGLHSPTPKNLASVYSSPSTLLAHLFRKIDFLLFCS